MDVVARRGTLEGEVTLNSFETFVEAQYGPVLGLVIAVYGRRDAEDVVQEAFERAHARWGEIASLDYRDRWVRRVALNLAASRVRRLKVESAALLRLRARREPEVPPLSGPAGEVWEHVRRLPTRQAQVLALRYLEDRSTSDIAALLGIAEATVRAVLYQGRNGACQPL